MGQEVAIFPQTAADFWHKKNYMCSKFKFCP